MGNNFDQDPFRDWTQQSITPDIGGMKTKGSNKLLVVVFIVDCSRSMEGERIIAVNNSLAELKRTLQDIKKNSCLELKLAIMSFTSSAKWELQLTDIDEVSLGQLKTRPGLTEYGNVFHELNKVLNEEKFMKHTGKIAPPAIMFLTDGGPTDDYKSDLEDLLKNEWFADASRSAVLLGDAINDATARTAVSRFVEDPENDIVAAEDSAVIIQRIKLATKHAVNGEAMDNGKLGGGSNIPSDPPNPGPFPGDFPNDPPFPGDFPSDPPFPDDVFPDRPIPDDVPPSGASIDDPFSDDGSSNSIPWDSVAIF